MSDENFLTQHARQRMAQRNLSADDLKLVFRYGRRCHAANATFYFLGKRDAQKAQSKELERLIGTTLVLMSGRLITAYRNRRAWAVIKRKPKWRNAPTHRLATLQGRT